MSAPINPAIPDESRQVNLRALSAVMIALVLLSTAARVVAKAICRVRLGVDDYFIVLGAVLNVVADSADILSTTYGFGRHAQYLTDDQKVNAIKWSQIAVIVAVFAIWATKASVCFFLLALIRGTHRIFRWAVYGLLFLTTSSTFIVAVLWGLQAHPIQKLWNPAVPGTTETPQDFVVVDYILFSFGALTDIFYALSPIYFLWNIQMDRKKKITILSLIGTGLLITVVAFLNIAFAYTFLDVEDITWSLINEFICDMIQRNMSLFVANLPALWVLISQIRQRVSTYDSSRGRTGYARDYGNGTVAPGTPGLSRSNTKSNKKGFRASVTMTAVSEAGFNKENALRSPTRTLPNSIYGRDMFILDEHDDIPLRDVVVHGGADEPEQCSHGGIQVSTEVEIHEERRPRTSHESSGQQSGWTDSTLETGVPGVAK